MRVLPRTKFGNPILRKKAKSVPVKTIRMPSFQRLINQMFFTMKWIGVGLAAPQIGKSIQSAVIEVKPIRLRPNVVPFPKTVIVNPKITQYSKKQILDWEGCLSLPGVRGMVPRAESIKVKYLDEKGKPHSETIKGFPARVFQHEIDHLNGLVYVDRMKDMKTLMTESEYKERVLKKK